jgi:KUP system potassium uptake protein
MVITSVLFCVAARRLWKWNLLKCTAFLGIFLLIEVSFALANLLKIANGGWVPLVLALAIFIVMTTWQMGRKALRYRLNKTILPLTDFMESLEHRPIATVSGTAVFMTGNPEGTPIALLHNLKHNKVLHQLTVILNIQINDQSHVNTEETLSVEKLNDRFYRVTGLYGFMDQPHIPELLESCQEKGLKINLDKTTYFLSSETIVSGRHSVLSEWRQRLFTLLSRNAQRATAFFRLPPNRVVELGIQVEV